MKLKARLGTMLRSTIRISIRVSIRIAIWVPNMYHDTKNHDHIYKIILISKELEGFVT